MSEERMDAPVSSQRLNEMVHGPRYRATLLESELMADELLSLRQLRALVLASRPALVTGADAVYACGLRIAQLFGQQHVSAQQALEHSLQLRTLSAYGVGT